MSNSIQDTLRNKFFDQFMETARQRAQTSQAAVSSDDPGVAGAELHSLAGEGSMLGFEEIAGLAREAETLAVAWQAGDSAKRVKCGRVVRKISRALDSLVQAPTAKSSPSESAGVQGGVLIVDDSELAAENLREGLHRNGIAVETAHDLEQAAAKAEQQSPSLILVDANIPGVETQALVSRMREVCAGASIFLFSGLGASELGQLAEQHGTDGFFSKEKGLAHIVEGVLQRLGES